MKIASRAAALVAFCVFSTSATALAGPCGVDVGSRCIFASSAQDDGDLGGLATADATCKSLADASVSSFMHGRSWRAWLSDDSDSAASRIEQAAVPYRLVDGTKVADDYTDLSDGSLDAAIDLDEDGGPPPGTRVWTGTDSDGSSLSPSNCQNWSTASSGIGGFDGRNDVTTSVWTRNLVPTCDQLRSIYCVEKDIICGDGFVDPGEDCDDGNTTGGDCCDASCGFETGGSSCGDTGTDCIVQDTCDGAGTCDDNGFVSSGTGCGDASDTECTDPDTCDGAGTCDDNHETSGASCGDTGTDCTVQDTCDGSGTCDDNGFIASGTGCGDGSDTECTDPDTCDGAGTCDDNHEAGGTNCGDAGTECIVQDSCNGSGGCTDNGFVSSGTGCGDPTDSECTDADTCDGAGSCQDNHETGGTSCGDTGTDCIVQDTCDGAGSCDDNGFVGSGTGCGDASDTECTDADTCNGAGTCLPNHETSGTGCGDTGTDCINQDTCDGSGTCDDNGFPASGSACGDGTDDDCTDPDTCDGSGTCEVNDEPSGFSCGDVSDTLCTNPDTCNGAGTCLENDEPGGVDCGDTGDQCTFQDLCDGTGGCTDNGYVTGGTVCDDGNPGTVGDVCDGAGTCTATGFVILCDNTTGTPQPADLYVPQDYVQFRLRNGAGGGDDSLVMRGGKPESLPVPGFDPVGTHDVHVTVRDQVTHAVIFTASIPPGPPWKASGKRWVYRDSGDAIGVRKMIIVTDGASNIIVRRLTGKNLSLTGVPVPEGQGVHAMIEITDGGGTGPCFGDNIALCVLKGSSTVRQICHLP